MRSGSEAGPYLRRTDFRARQEEREGEEKGEGEGERRRREREKRVCASGYVVLGVVCKTSMMSFISAFSATAAVAGLYKQNHCVLFIKHKVYFNCINLFKLNHTQRNNNI